MHLFDSHLHIVDPRFPLIDNEGYRPEPFTVEDYRAATAALEVIGGAVVSGSFRGSDHSYLMDALPRLGPGFVGVADVRPDCSDDRLRELAAARLRAVRFNLYRGGSVDVTTVREFGARIFDVAGMHVEIYLDAAHLAELAPTIAALPSVVVDHLGMTAAHRTTLLRLVEGGLRVKATGFGRVLLDVPGALREVHRANPHSLLFGTDLPGTRARRPFNPADLDVIADAVGADDLPAVLHDNAAAFYRMDQDPGGSPSPWTPPCA